MLFYDFEVMKYDWLVVVINPFEKTTTIIINDSNKLGRFYEENKSKIWVGYNSRNYDQYILKAILLGFDPKKVNDWIIVEKRKGWEYSGLFNALQLYNYDCMPKGYGLKQLESFMGDNIKETSVPFDIERPLTPEEIDETVKYCIHDVEETMKVFNANIEDFRAHLSLLKTFDLPIHNISKTQAQLSALALGCVRKEWDDEWDYSIIDTLRIRKYENVVNWFKAPENRNYSKRLTVNVCGVPHVFGWGGLHGAPAEPVHAKGLILHVDVASFYPSIMIRYDMLSRNVQDKGVYRRIYDMRLALKNAGKKREQAPYKIILNATYGICKDKYSAAYDPRQANNVCVNGQLLLLDLLEHLEPVEGFRLIQSNTDGLIIQIPDTDVAFEQVDDICYEWETRTGMGLSLDVIQEIYQKDVNNYLWIDENGEIERKGAYVKPLNDLDYDLAIVNRAIVDYMVKGVPVEETVNTCDCLRDFQKTVKVSSKYKCGWYDGKRLSDRTFRVFASKNHADSFIGKVKEKNGVDVVEKFANTPLYCFIENGDITGTSVPDGLDKGWYIELANKRLQDFGVRI